MWICLNDAFFSIVSSDRDPAVLNVRARRKGDLEKCFPGYAIHSWPGRDYAFRAFVPRQIISAAIAERIETIAYPNFKDSVEDDRLHDAYMDVWVAMRNVQK